MRNRMQALLEGLDAAELLGLAQRCAGALDEPLSAYRALATFVAALAAVADGADRREWSLLRSGLIAHPLMAKLRRDPLVAEAWRVAHGARSPEMALGDLMLRHPEADRHLAAADRIGRNLYQASSALPAAEAIRDRRRLIARLADAIAEQRGGIEVLAIGPGFMREAEASVAGPAGAIRRWVGLVAEAESAAEIGRSLPVPWVAPIRRNTLASLLHPELLGRFDLIYVKALEGVPDMLIPPLVRSAFARLKPGGRLLLTCRSPGAPDAAFWSLVADGALHLRDEATLARFAGAVAPEHLVSRRSFGGMNEAIAYLDLVRA